MRVKCLAQEHPTQRIRGQGSKLVDRGTWRRAHKPRGHHASTQAKQIMLLTLSHPPLKPTAVALISRLKGTKLNHFMM